MHFPTPIETPQTINETAAMLGLTTLPRHTQPPKWMDLLTFVMENEMDLKIAMQQIPTEHRAAIRGYMAWTKQARINSFTINKKREQQHQQKQLTNSAKVKLEQLSKKKAKER